jgi:hypothetical protein
MKEVIKRDMRKRSDNTNFTMLYRCFKLASSPFPITIVPLSP